MLDDTYLMQIGWDVIRHFVLDWRKHPVRWGYEVEIQAEIYGRLSKAYDLIGTGIFEGKYKNYNVPGMKDSQILNRVSCETSVENGEPDLIVWEDADPAHCNMEDNWPMLLVCEIKVAGNLGSSSEKIKKDEDKIKALLNKRAKYGCLLAFCQTKKDSDPLPEMLSRGEFNRFDIAIPDS